MYKIGFKNGSEIEINLGTPLLKSILAELGEPTNEKIELNHNNKETLIFLRPSEILYIVEIEDIMGSPLNLGKTTIEFLENTDTNSNESINKGLDG